MLIEKGRDKVITIIERVIREQLAEFYEELSLAQMKVIADQCAREAARRLADPNA
jgi:hypothetical protein